MSRPQRLEAPMHTTTYNLITSLLGLKDDQIAYDLGYGRGALTYGEKTNPDGQPLRADTVSKWRKRGADGQKRRPFPHVTVYLQEWLDRVQEDIDELVDSMIEVYKETGEPVTLYSAFSSAGLDALNERYAQRYAGYHSSMMQKMIQRALAELVANNVPTRVELIEHELYREEKGFPAPEQYFDSLEL